MSDTEIVRIRGYLVDPNLPPLILTGQDRPETRALELVRITLADGSEGSAATVTGWLGEQRGKVVSQLRERADNVLHRDACRPAVLNAELLERHADALPKASSLYDIAIWDAFARHLDTPLWQLLGGYRDSMPVQASTPAFLSIDEYVECTQTCIDAGYPAIKFHMNCNPRFDLEMVDAVNRTFSSYPTRFMVDLEQRYSIDDAITLGRKLSDLPYDWMEAPLADTDLAGYVTLNDSIGVDVLPGGNTLIGMENWEKGLSMGAWSRLRCDASNAGGITVACRAMALASAHGVANELQSYGFPFTQFANLAVMLAQPGCTWFEQAVPEELFNFGAVSPLTLDNRGHVAAPAGSGTGLTVDWEIIEENTTDQFDVY